MSSRLFFALLLAIPACSAPTRQSQASNAASSSELGVADIRELHDLAMNEVVDMPSTFVGQEFAPIQVVGYDGKLPTEISGKAIVAVPDYLAWSWNEAPKCSIYLEIVEQCPNGLRIKAANSWGTGGCGAEFLVTREGPAAAWRVHNMISKSLTL